MYRQADDSLTPAKSDIVKKNEPVARYLSIMYNLQGANIALFLKQKNKTVGGRKENAAKELLHTVEGFPIHRLFNNTINIYTNSVNRKSYTSKTLYPQFTVTVLNCY